ncbi:ATP-binding cassette domain-containing protein [Paenibacillus woosongensis]|uniref:ATP-binding cassette domain-containing protein n=1 Tax=Paenibacillus woosongensis TaxID=307580 RepID=A0A7X2Z4I6_9BACL|nr:ABC transporter ATP-binding protein [Paenibacillus woosongensis]MUG46639.1 ATP-binding cassette domain-containing protein [Paenibacillus woosongensis]
MISIDYVRQPVGTFTLEIEQLRLYPGLTLLVGPNGAGKSTLLRLLATVDKPRKGRIAYQGRETADHLPLIRSQIGYVPSDIELYEEMTTYKLLMYLAELKGVFQTELVDRLIRDFRLETYRNTRIKRLSIGVQRRIAIVQSLLAQPKFLFLDEPLNALDSGERKMAITYLTRYALGRVVVAAVHELNEWEAAANRILWLENGGIRFEGGAAEWKWDLPSKVWEGTVTSEQMREFPEQRVIFMRETEAGLFVRVVAERVPFLGLAEVLPSMEDAYFIRKFSVNSQSR